MEWFYINLKQWLKLTRVNDKNDIILVSMKCVKCMYCIKEQWFNSVVFIKTVNSKFL